MTTANATVMPGEDRPAQSGSTGLDLPAHDRHAPRRREREEADQQANQSGGPVARHGAGDQTGKRDAHDGARDAAECDERGSATERRDEADDDVPAAAVVLVDWRPCGHQDPFRSVTPEPGQARGWPINQPS